MLRAILLSAPLPVGSVSFLFSPRKVLLQGGNHHVSRVELQSASQHSQPVQKVFRDLGLQEGLFFCYCVHTVMDNYTGLPVRCQYMFHVEQEVL